MNKSGHTVAMGIFVMGAALIALITVVYLLGSGFGKKEKVVMVFDGSVTGLQVGAPMALRGVQVGQVTAIELILDSRNAELIMLVEADFDPSAIHIKGSVQDDLTEELLARGLRAQLNTQSLLTGLLFIQLDFHPGTELKLADIDSPYFQFPTVPTDLQRITRKLQDFDFAELADQLATMVDRVNSLVSDEDFQALPATASETLSAVTALSEQLESQLASSGPRLDSLLDKSAGAMTTAERELPAIARLLQNNLQLLDDALAAFTSTTHKLDGALAPDSPTLYQLNRALQEVARAGRSLQSLAQMLEREPEALLRGTRGD